MSTNLPQPTPPTIDFSDVRALIVDSDGVLTDGGVFVSEAGTQMRRFDIKDGLGLVRLREHGFPLAIISASPVTAVSHRGQQLGIKHTYVGERNKRSRVASLATEWGLALAQIAYIGDDLADAEVMQDVGFPIAVADAIPSIQHSARYVTHKSGGHGAVREVCDLILAAHGHVATFNPHAL